MSYLPFRDRAALRSIGQTAQGQIFDLAERLEAEARQAYHNSECGCFKGTADFGECFWEVGHGAVSTVEIIAALLIEDRLAPGALLPGGRASG